MVTTAQTSMLAVGMAKALAQLGLVSPDSKIKYLRHPLLLWHPGGRRYSPRPGVKGRQPWATRFIGVSMPHLRALGLSPSQVELDDAADEEIHAKAMELYASRLYFPGGFAFYLRVPAPTSAEGDAYDVQALRRFTWALVKKVGAMSPNEIGNAIFQETRIPFTRADAREVYPGARRKAEEVDALWDQLLSTARVPTVHIIGNPSAGFLIDLGGPRPEVRERVDLLWTGRTSWRSEGRTSSCDLSFPPFQILLAAGTVRAILGRTGLSDQDAPVWDPSVWSEVVDFLDGLPEHARCMALHLLLADSTDYRHLQKDQAMDYAYQILGLAPPPYEDRRQRFEVERSLRRAVRDLVEAANQGAPDCLQNFLGGLSNSLGHLLVSTGTTQLITPSQPQNGDLEVGAPTVKLDGEALDQALGTSLHSPTDTPPQPDEYPSTARQTSLHSPTNTPPQPDSNPSVARQTPLHSPTDTPPQHDKYPSVARHNSIEYLEKNEYLRTLPPTIPTHQGRAGGLAGGEGGLDTPEAPRSHPVSQVQVAPELMPLVEGLWDQGALGEWDAQDPASSAVLRELWSYLAGELRIHPLEKAPLLEAAVRTWTVEGAWALVQALREFKPEKSLRTPRRVVEPWLRGEFGNALPTTSKILRAVSTAVTALREERTSRGGDAAAHGQRLFALQALGLQPVPDPTARIHSGDSHTLGRSQGRLEAPGDAWEPRSPFRASGGDPAALEAWEALQCHLREELSEAAMEEWFSPLRPLRLDGTTLVVMAPSPTFRLWIESQLEEEMAAAKRAAGMDEISIEFVHGEGSL